MSDEELVIDGYRRVNSIAAGNSTQVIEVVEEGSGMHYAMKLLFPEALKSAEEKATLKREAKIGKSLNHPNIVQVHKVVITKQHGYLLMEYFRAPNVKAQLKGDLADLQSRFRKLFEGLCLAFAHMHEQGWIHKDIKPDNVLFNKATELKVIDFSLAVRAPVGLGKLLGSKSKVVQGTRTYIAPEIIRKQQVTFATDIYSLGILAFEVLTGRPPFAATTPSDLLRMHLADRPPSPSHLNPNVTPEMDRLIQKMLCKKPKDRFQSMNELYSEFRPVQPFKEDPAEMAEARRQQVEADRKAQLQDLSGRLDSRTDAERTELGLNTSGATPKQKKKPVPTPPKSPAKATQPSPQPPPPGYPQQMPPGYPQPMPPGYPYPGPVPPGYGPQYPMGPYPPQPGYPPQGPPQQPPQGPPQQPQPQRTPQPAQQPAPAAAQPAAPKKPEEKEKKPEPKPEELELMDIDDLEVL